MAPFALTAAHVWAGSIPDGLVVHHLCYVRACCNPDHLRLATQAENILDGAGVSAINARKQACPKGHRYDAVNTGRHNGARRCLTCHRERENARYHARKAS